MADYLNYVTIRYHKVTASLCFGITKTLLCEAKHPAGLSENSKKSQI